jgi:folylpolyglutamate synthase/dihydropteroate synthase
MKTYLTEWERTYTEARENNLFEISGNKALRDFLVSLADRESQYSNAQLMILKNSDDDLLGTIASFRQFIRMRKTENHKLVVQRYDERKLSAFSVGNNQGSTFNEQFSQSGDQQSAGQSARSNENKKKKSCLCGSMHRWGDCYYMILEKRLNG